MSDWTKAPEAMSVSGCDVYTKPFGPMNAVLTVARLRPHEEMKDAKVQERSLRITYTVRVRATFPNSMLEDAVGHDVEKDAWEDTDEHLGSIASLIAGASAKKKSPDRDEMIEMIKYLINDLGLADTVYDVRGRVDLDELAEDQSSWDHPTVVKFGKAIEKMREWIK